MRRYLILFALSILFAGVLSAFAEDNPAIVSSGGGAGEGVVVELYDDGGICFARFGPFTAGQTRKLDDGSVQITVDSTVTTIAPQEGGSPFFCLKASLQPKEEMVLEKIDFPTARVNVNELPIGSLKVFGTAGVTDADKPIGSYAFDAVADPETNAGLVCGWETSRVGCGVVFTDVADGQVTVKASIEYGKRPVASGEKFETEIFLIGSFNDIRLGLERYAAAIAVANNVQMKPPRTGYCTWYSDKFGCAGDEVSTAEFAKAAREKLVPYGLDFFQIDDQWQAGTSCKTFNTLDMLPEGPNKDFSRVRPNGGYASGIRKTADTLAENGLTCGIWFLPFCGNLDDDCFAGKERMFITSAIDYPPAGEQNTRKIPFISLEKGKPYRAFWGQNCLDATNPETIAYIESIVHRMVDQWHVGYFKTDGLWCGLGIEPTYVNDGYEKDDFGNQLFFDPSKTGVEAYRAGIEAVRRAAGDDVFILGCNVSQNMRMMLPSAGVVDAMRIGPDNATDWAGICSGPWRATNRYFLNGRLWWNDPDPVYVRDSIPLAHARVLASWSAISGQLYTFSDWLPDLSQERVDLLRKTIPPHGLTTSRPVDLLTEDLARVWTLSNGTNETLPEDTRFVIGLFNWNETESASFELTPRKLELPAADSGGKAAVDYVVYDYWNEAFLKSYSAKEGIFRFDVAGADCRILAIRPVFERNRPMLISTSRNVNQGIYEVAGETWDEAARELTVVIDPKKAALAEELPYELRFFAGALVPVKIECDGAPLDIRLLEEGNFAVTVNPDRSRFAGAADPVSVRILFER